MENSNDSVEVSRVPKKQLRLSELSCENDSTNCVELVHVSVSPFPEIERKFPKWTNEKHNLYIQSLETSFVKQLYASKDNLGWLHRREYATSEQKHSVIATPSGQYKVFQNGSWTRINSKRERPLTKQAYESGNFLSNPWIKHYLLTCNKGITVTDQTIIEGNEEVTDQNFVEEEKECRKCLKIGLRHDQVVPLHMLPLLGEVTLGDGSLGHG